MGLRAGEGDHSVGGSKVLLFSGTEGDEQVGGEGEEKWWEKRKGKRDVYKGGEVALLQVLRESEGEE